MARHDHAAPLLRTPSHVLAAFERELERTRRPPNTTAAYTRDARLFAGAYAANGGTGFPGGVQPADVREYLSTQRSSGASPATLRRRRAALVVFFRWAQAAGLARSSPMVDISLPSPTPPTRLALRSPELRKLLRAVHRHGTTRDIAICELFAATGIRVGELAALELGDLEIRERRGSISVRGKGYRSRAVPLHADVRRILREWLAARPTTDSALLFPGRAGGQLNRSTLERLLARYARLAGDLPHVTPHVLRHTLGTALLREHHVDPFTVQRLLGHASVVTTQLYTAPGQVDLEDAINHLIAMDNPDAAAPRPPHRRHPRLRHPRIPSRPAPSTSSP